MGVVIDCESLEPNDLVLHPLFMLFCAYWRIFIHSNPSLVSGAANCELPLQEISCLLLGESLPVVQEIALAALGAIYQGAKSSVIGVSSSQVLINHSGHELSYCNCHSALQYLITIPVTPPAEKRTLLSSSL